MNTKYMARQALLITAVIWAMYFLAKMPTVQQTFDGQVIKLREQIRRLLDGGSNYGARKSISSSGGGSYWQESFHGSPCKKWRKAAQSPFCGDKVNCGPRALCFMGRCFCKPGLTGIMCAERKYLPRALELNCQCHLEPSTRPAADHTMLCSVLCAWQEQAGAYVTTECTTWEAATNHALKAWTRSGSSGWSDDSDGEHRQGFDQFTAVPRHLGHLLEVGAGPYTQTKNIVDSMRPRRKPNISSITLADPNVERYEKDVKDCTYKSGSLRGMRGMRRIPITLISKPVEALDVVEKYDTIVEVNVVAHVIDALDFFTAVYAALKPGGVLIFHEKYHDHDCWQDSLSAAHVTRERAQAFYHPIFVYKVILDTFLSHFDLLYTNNREWPTAGMKARSAGACKEMGYYLVARKKTK